MSYGARDVGSVDLNGDGYLDMIAVLDDADAAHVWYGDGDRSFSLGTPATVVAPTRVVVADFNRDDFGDFAVLSESSGQIALFYGTAAGLSSGGVVTAADQVSDLLSCDLEADGFPDLVALASGDNPGVVVILNDGAGFGAPVLFADSQVYGVLTSGDFDADGVVDVATGYGPPFAFPNSVGVFSGLGNGQLAPAIPAATSCGYAITALATGDFDGDDIDDLVAAHLSGPITLFVGGTAGVEQSDCISTPGVISSIRVADVTNDGASDVVAVVAGEANTVAVFANDGFGDLAPESTFYGSGPSTTRSWVGDLDGDLAADIVFANVLGQVGIAWGSPMTGVSTPDASPQSGSSPVRPLWRPVPNPMTGGVVLRASSPRIAANTATLYDSRGRYIRQLVYEAGVGGFWWDGRDSEGRICGAGVYHCVLFNNTKVMGGARVTLVR
jgi:hypothetical protein